MIARFSLIMPAFNEGAGIRAAVEEAQSALLDHIGGAELIVVDDGSTDDTAAILREMAQGDSRIRVVHQPNQGHGAALNAGVASALSPVIMVVDADRPIALANMLPWAQQVLAGTLPAVMARRCGRRDGALRKLLSFGLSAALFVRFGRWVPDANVPCKILPRAQWVAAHTVPSAITAVGLARRGAVRVPVAVRDTGPGAGGATLWRTALGGLWAIYS